MQLPIEKIVDLHEIDQPVLQQPKRTIDLVKTGLLSTGPHLVAKNARERFCVCASRSPTTRSAAPYIGEESMTEPPAAKVP